MSSSQPAQIVKSSPTHSNFLELKAANFGLGLKIAQGPAYRLSGIVLAVASITTSGALLWLAQRDIPWVTVYAVWTGIGAAGTFLVGIWLFGDVSSMGRYLGVLLIIAGVVTLKLSH